ncbi:MAG: hypothetical protein GY771_01530 [bacterium]|nr:hypothetical protein [bacterium]
MADFEYDLRIVFEGEPVAEVTGVDMLLYAYKRIGRNVLDGGKVAFTGDLLDDTYVDAAGFTAGLIGAEDGAVTPDSEAQTELVYDINGLQPLVLSNSDKEVLEVKKTGYTLIDIALIGVIYDDLPDMLKDAVNSGRGVNSSVILSPYERFLNETNRVKNTYNIITDLPPPADLPDFTEYNELYIGSPVTVIASAIYGCISSGKRFY